MKNWSDDETLWQAMAPALAAPARFAAAEVDAEAIAAAAHLRPLAAVLDVGCGAGVHAIAFAARGYLVTGVDRSPTLLAVAQEHARARSLRPSFVQADMRDFACPSTFDLACSLNSSFGYFDDESNRQVLRNLRASLRAGGVLVLDVFGREAIGQWWQERASHEIGGSAYAVERTLAGDRSVLIENWTVTAQGVRKQFTVRQRIYSASEMQGELRRVGFRRVDLFGSLDAAIPYGQKAPRLVACARA